MDDRTARLEAIGSLRPEAFDRLVCLVGTPRGGTSMMHMALGVHDRVLALPDITYFMDHVWRYRRTVHDRLLGQIFQLPAWYRQEAVLDALDETRRGPLWRHIKDSFARRDGAAMWSLYPLVYALDKAQPKAPRGIACWVDKTNSAYDLEAIRALFPRARFLFLHRDPRSAVLSMAKRETKKATGVSGAPDPASLVETSIYWRHSTQLALRFARRHPGASFTFRYEEFVQAPEATLNRIFAFLGVEELPPQELSKRLAGVNYSATNDASERGRGIRTEGLERWRTALSPAEVDRILAITGPTAAKAGYPDAARPAHRVSPLAPLGGITDPRRKATAAAKLAYVRAFEPLV